MSSPFVLAVVDFNDPCEFDSITLNKDMPDSSETQNTQDFESIKGEPLLFITYEAFSLINYEVDLSKRVKLGLKNECSILNYNIAYVLDASNSNNSVDTSEYQGLLTMSPNDGVFRVNNFEK